MNDSPAVARRRAQLVKRARERAKYRLKGQTATGVAKAVAHKKARKRLLVIDPTRTCVAIAEFADHICSDGPTECHHRDGNWRNALDENLAWACRSAHEQLDRMLGI